MQINEQKAAQSILKVRLPGLRRTLHLDWSRPRRHLTIEDHRTLLEQVEYWLARGDRKVAVYHLVAARVLTLDEGASVLHHLAAEKHAGWRTANRSQRQLFRITLVPDLKESDFAAPDQIAGTNVVDLQAWRLRRMNRADPSIDETAG